MSHKKKQLMSHTHRKNKKPKLNYWLCPVISLCGLRIEYIKMYYHE